MRRARLVAGARSSLGCSSVTARHGQGKDLLLSPRKHQWDPSGPLQCLNYGEFEVVQGPVPILHTCELSWLAHGVRWSFKKYSWFLRC